MKSPSRFLASMAITAALVLVAATIASPQAAIVLSFLAILPLGLAAHYSLPPDPRAPIGRPQWHDVLVRFHADDPAGVVRVMRRVGLDVWCSPGQATGADQLRWLTVHVATPACSPEHAGAVVERIVLGLPYRGQVSIDSVSVLPDPLPRQDLDQLVAA